MIGAHRAGSQWGNGNVWRKRGRGGTARALGVAFGVFALTVFGPPRRGDSAFFSVSEALAQKGAAPKRPKKAGPKAPPPAPPASTAPNSPPEAPAPLPSPAASEPSPPTATPSKSAGRESTTETKTLTPPVASADSAADSEAAGRSYLFAGLRYRGTVLPQFLLNVFADEGTTLYSNSVGAELELRSDGLSRIGHIVFSEYGMSDVLFHEKGKDNFAGNWSVVNSSLKVLYFGADFLWSKPIAKSLELEYGAGVGLGIVFGDLGNNWVKEQANGPLQASSGQRFAPCAMEENPTTGCNKVDHQNASTARVGGYSEPSWFGGGAKPVVFPEIVLPSVGLRYKPTRDVAVRLGLGFSLTGFWFGVSGSYGIGVLGSKGSEGSQAGYAWPSVARVNP